MEIHPPIPERTTEQLLDIIETQEEWRQEVIDLAREELVRRGIGVSIQETRRKNKKKYNRRITQTKARASYTTIEKIFIVLLGPLLVVVFGNLLLFYQGEGYKNLNRQGLFFTLLGILLWGVSFYLYHKLSK